VFDIGNFREWKSEIRGVTRLDGARCKKHVWHPRVWT